MTTVYTLPGCSQCRMTAKALTSAGVDFTTVDLTTVPEKGDALREAGYMQAPIVETDTDTWTGFRPDKIAGLHH